MADFVIQRPALHPVFWTSFSGGTIYLYHDFSVHEDEEVRNQAEVFIARNIDPNIDDSTSGTSVEIRERPSPAGSIFGTDIVSIPVIVLDIAAGSRTVYSPTTFRYNVSSVVSCLPLIDGSTTPGTSLDAYGARWNRSQKNFSATITVALEGAGGGGVSGVSSLAAGDGISVAPLSGTGNVTITNLRNNLSELEDVRAANPTADQVLQYDNITGFWEAKTLTTPPPPDIVLGGRRVTLTSIEPSTMLDVEMPGPPVVQLSRGNYLAWDPDAGGPMPNPADGPRGAWNPQLPRISNNVDVALTANPPPTGHGLIFNGTSWVNTAPPTIPTVLNDLSDVNHTAAGGDLLHFNNTTSNWQHVPEINVNPTSRNVNVSTAGQAEFFGALGSTISSGGTVSVDALQDINLNLGSGPTHIVSIGQDAVAYAAKIGTFPQAATNVEFVNNQISAAIGAITPPSLALDDLTNVTVPTPNNFDILTYDDGTNTWIAAPPAPPTGVQWGLGGNAEGVFPGQDAIIDNTTARLVLAQGGVEFLQARTSWNIVLGDVANFDAQSPPNFPVTFYGSGIRSTGLGDTTFDVTADYGVISFSHVNMANSTPISFNVGNGAGAVLQYNVLGVGRDDAATMAAKIEAIPQAIPNMECITRAIAALPPPPTVPTVLNELTDVETVNPNNQFLWFNSTTNLWEGSPRITVDPSVNENVRINMVGNGTFQLDDAIAGNLLSSVVGGAITLGASARDVIVSALESTHTSQGNATFTAGGSVGLTSGNVVNITTGTANPSDLILQLGKTAVDYATDCTGVDNAIPNVRYVDQAINGLSSVYVVNGNNSGGVNVSTGGNQNINFSCVGGVGTQQQIIMTPSVNSLSYVQIGTAFKTPEDYRDHVLALGTGDRDSAVPNVALVDSRIGTVAPAAHTHPQSEIDGLVSDLLFLNDTKATKGGDITAPGLGVYALGTTDNNSEVQLLRNNAPFIRSTTTNFVAGTNTLPSIYQGDSINILSNNEAIELTSLAKDVSVVVGNASTSLAKISTTYKTVAGYASQIRAFADGSCIPNRQFVDEATDRHRCGGAFQGNTDPTVISVAGNVAAIAGTVTSYTSGFTVSGTTFFQYNGADTATFHVSYTATPAITSVDRTAVFTCWLSPSGPVNPTGSPILGSRSRVITRGALTHTGTASASFYVSMTSGQSLRFYVSNTDAANDIIVEDFSMTALRVSQLLV